MKRRICLFLLVLAMLLLLLSGCANSVVGTWKGDSASSLADSYRFGGLYGQDFTLPVDFGAQFNADGTGKIAIERMAVEFKWSVNEDGLLTLGLDGSNRITCYYEVSGSTLVITPTDTELPIPMRKASAAEREQIENAQSWDGYRGR